MLKFENETALVVEGGDDKYYPIPIYDVQRVKNRVQTLAKLDGEDNSLLKIKWKHLLQTTEQYHCIPSVSILQVTNTVPPASQELESSQQFTSTNNGFPEENLKLIRSLKNYWQQITAMNQEIERSILSDTRAHLMQLRHNSQCRFEKTLNALFSSVLLLPDEPVDDTEPVEYQEPVGTIEPVEYQEPVNETEIGEYLEPVNETEPMEYLEPVSETEPLEYLEPVSETEPMEYLEPVSETEPMEYLEPVSETEPMEYLEPVSETEPVEYLEPVSETEPMEYLEPVSETEPVEYLEPIDEAEPMEYLEPVDEAEPMDETEPVELWKQLEGPLYQFQRMVGYPPGEVDLEIIKDCKIYIKPDPPANEITPSLPRMENTSITRSLMGSG